MNLQIELRPHVGKQVVSGLGEVDVEFDQYMIFITGQDYKKATGSDQLHAGYVAKQPKYTCPRTMQTFDTPINWLPVVNQWPPAVVDALSRSVQRALASLDGASDGDKQLATDGQTRPVNVPAVLPAVVSDQANASSADDENL